MIPFSESQIPISSNKVNNEARESQDMSDFVLSHGPCGKASYFGPQNLRRSEQELAIISGTDVSPQPRP